MRRISWLIGLCLWGCVEGVDVEWEEPEEIGYLTLVARGIGGAHYCIGGEDMCGGGVRFENVLTGRTTYFKLIHPLPMRWVMRMFEHDEALLVRLRRLDRMCVCRTAVDVPIIPLDSIAVMGQVPLAEVVEILEE